MNASDPILALQNITLGQQAARFSLEVCKSEIVVVAGQAGAEKSELLLTAAGFREALHGSVRLFGADLSRRYSGDSLDVRRKTGFVFQDPVFIHNLSALENIELPLLYDDLLSAEEIGRRIREVLQDASLSGDLTLASDDLPPIDRRKLALARAWVRQPGIVFYDEPVKGLDPLGQKKIYQIIHAYHEKRKRDGNGCAALLACNDPRWILEFADRYLVLHAGILTSKADPTNIRGRKEALEREFLEFNPTT